MSGIGEILTNTGTFLVAIGALMVLFKIAGLVQVLSDRIKEWKD